VANERPSHILIVEDEEAHAELICRSFEDAKGHNTYVVSVATSLRDARRSFDTRIPDLVVTDLLLPDGKGIELAQDRTIAGRVPLIVMTSHGNEEIAVTAMKAGALDYVVKSDEAFRSMPRTVDRILREWGHMTERTRAEQELKEREAELFAIYENAPLIMMLLDSDRKVRKANVAATLFSGRQASELIGLSGGEALRCVHSLEDPQGCGFGGFCEECRVLRTVMDTFEAGRSHCQVEASLPCAVAGKEETLVFLLSTARLMVGDQPVVLASILDISARKRAEEELRESEQRFRGIFENDHIVMLIIDPETGNIEDGSPGACAFYGLSREELKKQSIFAINTLSRGEVCEKMHKATSRQEKYFAFKHRLANGEIRDVEVCSGSIIVGGRTLLFSVIDDVTERKSVEDALRQSEERFRTVFESAEECIFIKDRSLRYTHVNAAMCRLLGLSASRIVGKSAQAVYGREAARQFEEREARVLAGESIETEQTRLVRGTNLTFHETLAPLRNGAGDIIGICGISRDITGRRKLASESHTVVQDYPSAAMRNALKETLIAARTDSIVLLQGESGSGKDFLARWLHDHSKRASGPFFSINCAALPRELAESELFGHERGAFTGAASLKKGLLELAEGGTILLNEIGELELPSQSKLLTFLDTQSFLRVGGEKRVQVHARVIAATHRDLMTEVRAGRFLEPLFYRLNVFPIHVPPLRERAEDIPELVGEIMSQLAVEMQLNEIPRISSRHLEVLHQYHWPGNVRELRNVLERSLILWTGGEFNLVVPQASQGNGEWCYTVRYLSGTNLRDVTNSVESSLCAEVLRRCNGNKKEAARLLDISRDTLYRLIKKAERESGK
jgi:PAS domain S-box-containing protein